MMILQNVLVIKMQMVVIIMTTMQILEVGIDNDADDDDHYHHDNYNDDDKSDVRLLSGHLPNFVARVSMIMLESAICKKKASNHKTNKLVNINHPQ